MVCASFGAPSLTAHVKAVSILNALLALICKCRSHSPYFLHCAMLSMHAGRVYVCYIIHINVTSGIGTALYMTSLTTLLLSRQRTLLRKGVIFGILGCVSYSNSDATIATAPWTLVDYKLTDTTTKKATKFWTGYGLRAAVSWSQLDGDDKDPTYGAVGTYKDCLALQDAACTADPLACLDSSVDYCKKCDKAGTAVVSMCSLALIAAFLTFLAHLLRSSCDSTFAKDISILGGVTAFVFGVISFSIYQPCGT